jgi:hypothetical protein
MKQRATPIVVTLLLEVVGYAMAVSTKNPHARCVFLVFSKVV